MSKFEFEDTLDGLEAAAHAAVAHVSPNDLGKFEDEPCYAATAWEAVCTGCMDEEFYEGGSPTAAILIDADLIAKFPCCLEPSDAGKYVVLYETEQGFVNTDLLTRGELDERIAESTEESGDEE